MTESLRKVLDDFEARNDAFSEATISAALDALISEHGKSDPKAPDDLKAEAVAFRLMAGSEDRDENWGEYYGPWLVKQMTDGRRVEAPPLHAITAEVIDYWEKRAAEAKHPLLRCRYADLVWDLRRVVCKSQPKIQLAWQVIDATLDAVTKGCLEEEFVVHDRLERALAVAISINDPSRIGQVRDFIVSLAERFDDPDEKRRAAQFAFEQLADNKKVPLSPQEQQKLFDSVEALLLETAGGNDRQGAKDHFSGQVYAALLATQYRKQSREDDVKRVLRLYGETVIATANDASAMVGSAWLQQLHDIFASFNMPEDAEAAVVALQEKAKGIRKELRPVSVSAEIPTEELESALAEIVEGTLSDALSRIAVAFITDIDAAKDLVHMVAKKSIVMSIMPQQLVDHEGRPIVQVGSIKADEEGHLILQLSKNMQFDGQFLRPAVERLQKRFSPNADQLLEFIAASPLYPPDRHPLLRAGLDAYLRSDWIASIHILVPQIENALRRLLRFLGRPAMKRHRNGGMILKNLDEILREEKVARTFGNRVTVFLRTLLCDQRGWNVRNNVCHGLWPSEAFNFLVADRVFQVLMLLSTLRPVQEPENTRPAESGNDEGSPPKESANSDSRAESE
jgi:hypothetical protein